MPESEADFESWWAANQWAKPMYAREVYRVAKFTWVEAERRGMERAAKIAEDLGWHHAVKAIRAAASAPLTGA